MCLSASSSVASDAAAFCSRRRRTVQCRRQHEGSRIDTAISLNTGRHNMPGSERKLQQAAHSAAGWAVSRQARSLCGLVMPRPHACSNHRRRRRRQPQTSATWIASRRKALNDSASRTDSCPKARSAAEPYGATLSRFCCSRGQRAAPEARAGWTASTHNWEEATPLSHSGGTSGASRCMHAQPYSAASWGSPDTSHLHLRDGWPCMCGLCPPHRQCPPEALVCHATPPRAELVCPSRPCTSPGPRQLPAAEATCTTLRLSWLWLMSCMNKLAAARGRISRRD